MSFVSLKYRFMFGVSNEQVPPMYINVHSGPFPTPPSESKVAFENVVISFPTITMCRWAALPEKDPCLHLFVHAVERPYQWYSVYTLGPRSG